jgi:hypothetical protein
MRHFAIAALMLLVACGCHHNHEEVVYTTTSDPTTAPVPETTPAPTPPLILPQAGPGDKALCVGINAYPGCPLNGCVNDANDMHDYLIKWEGFKPEQIKVLTDADATCANITAGLNWLVADAKPGDRRLFHYSGHGAEDAVADFQNDPDHLNQMICPVDFDWTAQHEIIDKQFVEIFKAFPAGVLFNWVSDSCHSGDLDRVIAKPGKKMIAKQYPNVPDAVKKRIQAAKSHKTFTRGLINGTLDVGYVAGCAPDQTSADTQDDTGRPCGALTHYFLTVMKNPALNTKPISVVVFNVDQTLAQDGYDQVPQAEGARKTKPFLK